MAWLLDRERIKLGVHIRKMNSPGSPVYRYAENIWPVAAILGLSFAATSLVHFYLGAVLLAAGCYWWIAKVQPDIKDGVFDRASAWALQSETHFDALWSQGVLSLFAELPDGTKLAATRKENWRSFIRDLPPSEDEPAWEEAA
ncbi:hypothetical protein C8P66_12247 [Humitalea rosea]|uniref:Uncharacterized protein n=1 Tax=Humitalea rosea TaxID=990373 RepID=A0A2W7K056_9PROT|nr:hypothetical protein [Humitalea rosea]PZW41060.1 hypothetical protein C8P66_12247 [Humitalea rosea]